jgi:hypothetical protein
MKLLEKMDAQVDKSFELKQHIEFIRKEIIEQRRRQNRFISELEELYRKRDAEIRSLANDLHIAKRTKKDLETRRDVAYDDAGDLYAQRSMWLNFVSDSLAH